MLTGAKSHSRPTPVCPWLKVFFLACETSSGWGCPPRLPAARGSNSRRSRALGPRPRGRRTRSSRCPSSQPDAVSQTTTY
eukprot:1340554-Pyramimonas_sp.AAC.1